TLEEWERFRDSRIETLRRSLGQYPPVRTDLKVLTTRTFDGEGYAIDNLVFESRPGWVVMANLYRPAKPSDSMPGILICHSHHNAKTQSELQDMGVTWARLGCLVLVMDQVGHGERRQHPFRNAESYPHPFRVGRQDYYFRYHTGMQLATIGDSLIGWMVWDLSRGVDLLLSRRGIDRERIVLLGAVAGGGDPAAVAAALDRRICAVVPFNFGGPQPETRNPLPADAEASFNYSGGGSWESTRNLRLSARDGFLPWVIVGAAAPRGLVYAHEFAWDRERDPVWARLQKVFGFYGAGDRLASVHGRGSVSGKPPESTHCNNIGPEHRPEIYTALNRWFGIAPPEHESSDHRTADELAGLTPEAAEVFRPRTLHDLAAQLGTERAGAARARLAALPPAAQRDELRRTWAALLGDVDPRTPKVSFVDSRALDGATLERLSLEVEGEIVVPCLLLLPPALPGVRPSVVVAVAQGGKQEFLRQRSREIATLVTRGVAVCLPDVRGTGETQPGDGRGRNSSATGISSTELMLGQTLVGSRLRDLRSVVQYLRRRRDLDAARLGLWGDSFAPANANDRELAVPLDADGSPDQSEPLGGHLAMFGALFEDDVRAVYARGGLTGFQSLLQSPFCYFPHDCLVPAALTAADLCDVAATFAPRPLRLAGMVDGTNRVASAEALADVCEPTLAAYHAVEADEKFDVAVEPAEECLVDFFAEALAK
ncbi:MAG TPA: acetylxylan esterase, partial [Pirellulales bacterium]|nr:acetylxylan esterase [Pirellulales bacterium]